MSDTFTRFQEAYQAADQATKDLIDSEQIGLFADEIVTTTEDGKQKRQIIVILSNRILDIITDSEMVDGLEQLGIGAESISKAKAFVDQKDTVVAPISSIEEDLAEIEKSLHQINPVRTMASDGKQIGYSSTTEDTYTSTQSAIINESK